MGYEYEKTIKNLMNNAKGVSWTNINTHKDAYDELQEVYRKAKLFDKLVKFYPSKDELSSDEFFDEMGYIIKEAHDET